MAVRVISCSVVKLAPCVGEVTKTVGEFVTTVVLVVDAEARLLSVTVVVRVYIPESAED